MRDQEILGQFRAIEGMVSTDIRGLQRQLLLLRTRLDGFERLLFASRWGFLKAILIQMLSPAALAVRMQTSHSEQIKLMNEALAKSAAKTPGVKQAPVTLAVSK